MQFDFDTFECDAVKIDLRRLHRRGERWQRRSRRRGDPVLDVVQPQRGIDKGVALFQMQDDRVGKIAGALV